MSGTASGQGPRDGPSPSWFIAEKGHIAGIGTGAVPDGAAPLGDGIAAPGLVDLQINGVDDIEFATAEPPTWIIAMRRLAKRGVTACCPTIVTQPLDAYGPLLRRAAVAREAAADDPVAAKIIGIHLEGPFLGAAPGAHRAESICAVDLHWLQRLVGEFGSLITMVTLAPEADPDLAAVRFLRDSGVIVALGHSLASFDEARAAADAGASMVTHLFNAMGPWHHREPGLIGAALDDQRLTPSVIADLCHVHPGALRLVAKHKPSAIVVSDAVARGSASFDGSVVAFRDGAAYSGDGLLCGATVLLDGAVRNLVGAGISPARAIEMASTVPAALIGDATRGRLAPGARADIVTFEPTTLSIRKVWLGGVEIQPQ